MQQRSGWIGSPAPCGGRLARCSGCAGHAPFGVRATGAETRRQVAAENGQAGRATQIHLDGSSSGIVPATGEQNLSGPEQNRTKTVQNRTETEQRWIGMGVQPCRRPERSGGLRQGCRCALALLRRRRAGKVPAMKTSNWSTAIPSDLSAASSKISTRVLSTPPLPPHIWG